jgi:hypothetical protein
VHLGPQSDYQQNGTKKKRGRSVNNKKHESAGMGEGSHSNDEGNELEKEEESQQE